MCSMRQIRTESSVNSQPFRFPFPRLLIPFACGILAASFLYNAPFIDEWGLFAICFSAVGILLLCSSNLLLYRSDRSNYRHRWQSGAVLFIFLFAGSFALTRMAWEESAYPYPDEPAVYTARILTPPREHPHTLSCRVRILSHSRPDNGSSYPHTIYPSRPPEALVYCSKYRSGADSLRPGRLIRFQATLSPPRNFSDSTRFDYASYLHRNGISATGYASRWTLSSASLPDNSMIHSAGQLRERLLALYRQYGFHQAADYGLLAALTLGSKQDLTPEVRQLYADAGVAHILAVSGLHTGIIYLLAHLLLSLIFPYRLQRTKQAGALAAVWIFAFLSGLQAPVLRAAIGFSALTLANLLSARTHPLNTLAAIALLLLTFRPLWLFDLSFQLSFSAVAGILLWAGPFMRLCPSEHPALRYLWNTTAVTLSAQLAILPLTLYHFGSFPTYFLLTNPLFIPLATLIVGTAALLLLSAAWLPQPATFIATLLRYELQTMESLASWFTSLPGATLTELHIPLWETLCIALALLSGIPWLISLRQGKRNIPLILPVCLLTILLGEGFRTFG